jgi:hypothetical protein
MASGEMSEAAFRGFLAETLGACAGVSRDGAVHFICMDWRHVDDVSAVGGAIYGDLLNLCVWNKSNAGMGSLYRSKHELVFVYRVGEAPHLNAVELGRHGRNRTNVWDYASVNSLAGSRREDLALLPTVKPTALVADAIQDVTRRGELVLDTDLPPRFVPRPKLVCFPSVRRPGSAVAPHARRPERAAGAEQLPAPAACIQARCGA